MAVTTRTIRLTVIPEPIDSDCPDCGYAALIRIRAYHLTINGVSALADVTRCGRCAAEEHTMSTPDL